MTASWTGDRVDRLKTLWLDGRSAAEIARDLGQGVTRSAVLGKVWRLGLSAGRPVASTPVRAAASRAVGRPSPARAAPPSHRSRPLDPPTGGCGIDAPSHGTATLLSVRRFDCRWPYGDPGDPDFALCGRKVARGAFCAAHAGIGYRPVRQTAEGVMTLAGLA